MIAERRLPEEIHQGEPVSKRQIFLRIFAGVSVCMILAFWFEQHLVRKPDKRIAMNERQMSGLVAELRAFKEKCGTFPKPIGDLSALRRRDFLDCGETTANKIITPRSLPHDPFGHPYVYRLQSGKLELVSLGADGVAGGEGVSADIVLPVVEEGMK